MTTHVTIKDAKAPATNMTVADIPAGDYFIADEGELCLKLDGEKYIWLQGTGRTNVGGIVPVENLVTDVVITYE